MKYYLIKITEETAQDTQVVFAYDSWISALMAFHQEIAAAMAYETVLSCLCMIVDSNGVLRTQERFDRETA